MSRSNWADWRRPDFRGPATSAGWRKVRPDEGWGDGERDETWAPIPHGSGAGAAGDRAGFSLIPLFPIGSLTPTSACPHKVAIPEGSRLYCVVCHDTGMRDHPSLKRTAADVVAIQGWKPPDGRDQWSRTEADAPTERLDRGQASTRRQKRAARYSV